MSKSRIITLKCPECGEEYEFECYDSVNITLDPDLIEKIYDASLFIATCPKCGHEELLKHPLLYNDMQRRFMIKIDSYANLLDFKEDFTVQNDPDGLLSTAFKAYKIIGVTTLHDMATTIAAMENNLDWRVVQLVLYLVQLDYVKYCNDNKIKIKNVNFTELLNQKDDDGNLMVMLNVGKGKSQEAIFTIFPMEAYEIYLKEYKERLDLLDPFIFDQDMRAHFCEFYEEDFQLQEEHKNSYVYVERPDGSIVICDPIPLYLKDKLEVGKLVLFDRPSGTREIGQIKRIVEWNFLRLSIPKDCRGSIYSEYVNSHMLCTVDNNVVLNQEELVKSLVDYKNTEYKNHRLLPIEKLDDCNLLICSIPDDGFEELCELIKQDVKTGDVIKFAQLQKIERDGKLYLAAYSDPLYLPSKKDYIDCGAFPINDLVAIVKNNPQYSGIIINPYDEDIVLDFETLKIYIGLRTLLNRKKIKELFDKLTVNEKEYISELSCKVYYSTYFEGLNENKIIEKYNITKKQYDDALNRAKLTLDKVILARF